MGLIDLKLRILSYLFSLGILLFASREIALVLIIFMGQGHFVLAYWYKFEKISNLLQSAFFWTWIISLGLLFALEGVGVIGYHFLLAVTAIVFVTHFIIDEVTLMGEVPSSIEIVGLFLGIITIFLLEIITFILSINFNQTLLIFLAFVTFISTSLQIRKQIRVSYSAVYSLGLAAIASIIILLTNQIYLSYGLGFIILAHYFIWYFHYYIKFSQKKKMQKLYVFRALGVNLIMFLFWALPYFQVSVPLYRFVFSEVYFYIWTCIHILFSFVPIRMKLPFFKK